MAILTVQQPSVTGVAPSLQAAAAGGDSFANDGTPEFYAENAHATLTRTVTLVTQLLVDGDLAVADRAVVVPALGKMRIGPLDTAVYNDANGRVVVTYSDAAANLSVAAYKRG